jgi:hypothetical protein
MTAIPTSFASAKPPAPRPWSRGRTILALLVLTFVGFSGWGIFRWWTYPTVPDVATVDLNTAINFMGSDDFNRMLEGHRLRYAMAVVDRLSQSSFGELSMMMMRWNERRAKIARNLRDIEGSDQLGSKLFAVFLDKFYAQSPAQQKAALFVIAAAQQGQINQHPAAFALPSTTEFKQDMGRFLSRQPPKVQAMCGQFLIDLKKQRDVMGLKDPF